MSEPYHSYVFDGARRKFVGAFEDMYRNEDAEGYDSWHQEDLTTVSRRISRAILDRHEYRRILDIGCGKGAFTSLLKRPGNEVIGIDVSETAIAKAQARDADIDFRCLETSDVASLGVGFDLVLVMEVLSYLSDWRDLLATVASMTRYLYVTLYVPADPIGFVKSFDELRSELRRSYDTETEVLLNGEQLLALARRRSV